MLGIQFAPPPFTASMSAPMSEQAIEALRARNNERFEAARQALGRGYLLHPANRVQRKGQSCKS